MGRSMYNFGKQSKEKARQQKQIEKASKRIMARQQKASLIKQTPDEGSNIAEPELLEEIDKT